MDPFIVLNLCFVFGLGVSDASCGGPLSGYVEHFKGWNSLIQYNTSDTLAFVLLSCLFFTVLWSPAGRG